MHKLIIHSIFQQSGNTMVLYLVSMIQLMHLVVVLMYLVSKSHPINNKFSLFSKGWKWKPVLCHCSFVLFLWMYHNWTIQRTLISCYYYYFLSSLSQNISFYFWSLSFVDYKEMSHSIYFCQKWMSFIRIILALLFVNGHVMLFSFHWEHSYFGQLNFCIKSFKKPCSAQYLLIMCAILSKWLVRSKI